MAKSGPSEHIEAAKRRLIHLSGLTGKVDGAERRILEAAEHRLAAVSADLASLRPRVNTDPAAAGRYQDLVLERGQLAQVIASAKRSLAC